MQRLGVTTQSNVSETIQFRNLDAESSVGENMDIDIKNVDTNDSFSKDTVTEDASSITTFYQKKPWEHIDEIMTVVKTAYPLLALSIETMTDQMLTQLKPSMEEDLYRVMSVLYNDGLQVALYVA